MTIWFPPAALRWKRGLRETRDRQDLPVQNLTPNRYTGDMINIGIDARLTYYRTGGISTYMRRLIHALESLDRRNHYTIFHSRKADFTISPQFRRASLWTPSHHRIERLALSVELARFRLNVLHSPDFIPPYRGAKSHVITVHDLTFLHYPQHLTADSRRYYNDQITAATRHADHILAVSESAKTDLITMLNVPAEKITVQPHGVESVYRPMTETELAPFRRQYNLPEKYLLFVGTLEPRKNIAGLLDAYEELKTCLPETPPLALVGHKGWLIKDTLARAEKMKDVMIIENATDEDLPALYNMASLLVLPSFYEGFGMPALEAMACGTIPVVSNCSSLPEVVGEVGLQINPDDPETITRALYQILTADDTWLQHQREAAIQRAATFTWQRSAEIALSVYEAVI